MNASDKVDLGKLIGLANDGAHVALAAADRDLQCAIAEYGPEKQVEFPETAYGMPCICAWEGIETITLGGLATIIEAQRSALDRDMSMESALAAGEAVMVATETIEALRYLGSPRPYEGTGYCGFIPDKVLRELGVALVDDTIPGAAVLIGEASDVKELVALVKDLQSKGILIIVAGKIIGQLRKEGIRMGLDRMLYPLGEGTQVVHGLNFVVRSALSFGGVQKGDREALKGYLSKRPKVFLLEFGNIDNVTAAVAFAAIIHGAVIVTDQNVEEVPGVLVRSSPDKMVQTALEVRNIRVKLAPVNIPVAYGPAFEGETVRRPDTYIEAGGTSKTITFELLRSCNEDEVEDGRITVIGNDVDSMPEGGATALAILVKVYGKKMQEDFEPVLERRIHQFVNYAEGAWHTGQRNILWIRLSKASVHAGLRFRHFGDILITKLKEEFGNIISRVQVTIVTDEKNVRELLPMALEAYSKRDARLAGLTDENVDTFYSCSLCSSFAPDHICIISPERLGLCGAINWLDAKAAQEIAPTGPNQNIRKGMTIDLTKGQWEGVNQTVFEGSHHKIERFNAYTMMEDPMTSCGCFEVIVAMTADAQAVIAVNREYPGMTPVGLKFSSLAGSVGGGRQTPGFIGIGRKYLTSRKFIPADGGFLRIAWMPKDLKTAMKDALERRAKELGEPSFIDKIADETITTDAKGLSDWMVKVDHPALRMPSLLQ